MRKPTAIDLFAGAGGVTTGLRGAGFDVIGAVEIDPLCVEGYRSNHTPRKIWDEDIAQVTTKRVLEELGLEPGELDLLAGCPPCQGFSRLRTLQGKKDVSDPQKDLIFEFQRFVEELKPKTIMLENVPGLLDDDRMRRFKAKLKQLGYQGEPMVLDAADYGVPQRRKRLIYIASRLGIVEPAPKVKERTTVRKAIQHLPSAGSSSDPLHDVKERRSKKVAALIKKIPKDGGSRTDLKKQLACHSRCDGFYDVYGRMKWDDVAPTITSGCFNPSKGRFLHPTEDRAITLREAALLQSFPHDYRFPLSRGKEMAALLIGNAFPPLFVKRHAEVVRQHLEVHATTGAAE